MGEVLKTWFRRRLGVLMELTPELFGHHTRDGHLLAQILHSYGIINCDQLDTIIQTKDPALCRVNLKHLRIWLRFIGVDCTDDCIEEISCGKGATALQLFYKVYLSLEDKDSLYFITLQKEREKYIPTSRKFDVIPVPEEPIPYEPPDHPLSKSLTKATSTIEWHRSKFQKILESCRKERKKLHTLKMKHPSRKIDRTEPILPTTFCDTKDDDVLKEMNDFARKHRIKPSKYIYDPCLTDKVYDEIEISAEDPEAAKAYISWLKNRKRKENIENTIKSRMQNILLSELWKTLIEKQEKSFDELLARRVLDQSHYEKQIVTKLSEVRNQKNIMTDNRRIVDRLMLDAKESKARLEQERTREEHDWEYEDVDIEYQRLCELHRRIRKEKLKKLREKHERICREALQELVDIAVKVAEYRRSNEGCVPKPIWNEWKTLFLKCQPIFELLENEFAEGEEEEEVERKEKIEEIVQSRLDREEVLNEANFESYHTLQSPWDEYVPPTTDPEIEEILKLGELVLGYIVHRLLEFVYPYPIGPLEAPVPKVKTAAIILGVIEPRLYNSIQILLKKSGIRLVSMEDAINYCLLRYKEEMLDVKYIDANIIRATEKIIKRSSDKRKADNSKKNTVRSRKTLRSSKASVYRKEKEKEKGLEEKETQTPRVIPYDDMDPILSDAAYVGKWTYEFLMLGQPISNELNTKIILEYLKSLGEIEGWALIDYPNSYDQMARLEFALTGHKVPQDDSTVVDFENINIEEIDPVSSRIVYEDAEINDYILYRQSKLLPNPIIKKEDYTSTSTFMTTYVRAIPKPKDLDIDANKLVEVLSEDATSLDKFYTEQNIAYVVYYDYFDINTIKKIARLVIGDKSMPRTPSVELFGQNALKSLEERKEWSYKESSKKMSEMAKQFLLSKQSTRKEDEEGEMKVEDVEASGDYIDVPRAPKPGEDGWEWLDFSQSPILLDALATLWENLEEIYIFDLMEIFSLMRTHSSAIVPYKDFVMRNMKEFIERPNTKQNLLQEFQYTFNNVSEDMRDDEEVKCELHCRLTEFQTRLWDICDLRRSEAEEERQRIIRERWTDVEAVILVNIYLSILQAEIDRCVDTIQMIQDYYTSMLQKPIQESRFSKILLDRLNIHEITSQENKKIFDTTITEKDKKDKKDRKDTRSKTASEKTDFTKPIIDRNDLTREISNLFVDAINSRIFVPTDSLIYKAIIDNVNYVRKYVEFIATIANGIMKKEENILTSRERTWKKAELSADNISEKLTTRGHELFEEWRYAMLFEINRIKIRLDIISASAEADVNFLLDTMRFTFHRIYDRIVDRYEKEKNSIDEMIKVFRFAIEEEKAIQEELVLDGEHFYVRSNILMYPEMAETPVKLTRESVKPFLFTIAQLGRLMNVFKMIAPSGKLTERSLVYVLQDMISYNKEEEDDGFGSMPIPSCWRLLRLCDVSKLVEMIFGRCEYIEWREFLIYAINLPTPTQEDILRARDRFRMLDLDLKEIVTIDQYRSIPLWFFEYTDEVLSDIKHILFDDFQRPFENLFEEEIDFVNPDKLVGTMVSEKAMDYVRDFLRASKRTDDKVLDDDEEEIMVQRDAEETLRLMLAKELLCQMYLIDRHSVNYTALLLAFCKDEDPRKGLGKAFSLAIGARVCTDFEEGEKYVEKILEEKRLSAQLESMRNLLREEAIQVTEEIINHLLNKAIAGVIIEEESEYVVPRRIRIEKLDEPGSEIDPSMFLSFTQNFEQISDSTIDRSDEQLASSIMAENYHEFEERIERMLIYWLPYDICLAVLLATLPWHASQPDLFQTTKTLRKLLRDAYEDLYDEELSNDKDTVLSHRFLNHNFIIELLESTSKFTVKRLGNLLSEIITEEQERNL